MQQGNRGMVADEETYLDAVENHSPASTKEVADAVGVTRQGADYRLRQLEEMGKVTSKKIGNSLAWRLVANGEIDE